MTFEEWIKTDAGKQANTPLSTWAEAQPYLQSRLYYAFEAGVASGDHDERLYKTLQYYNETVKKLRSEIRELKKANKILTAGN